MIKLGIDLSTTNVGVCVITSVGTQLYDTQLWSDNYLIMTDRVLNFVDNFYRVTKFYSDNFSDKCVTVGIEVSNFKNAKLTSKFNLLCGMIMEALIILKNKYCYQNVDIKLFNSNQWQSLIGCKQNEERAQRKLRARQFAFDHSITEAFKCSDDITDAFCIAYLLEQLDDVTTTSKKTKEKRAKQKASYKQEMRQKLNDAKRCAALQEKIKRYELLLASRKRLTKAQESALNKLRGEIK